MRYLTAIALLFIMSCNETIEETEPISHIELIETTNSMKKAKVSYTDFEKLVNEVKTHREKRLINLKDFIAKNEEGNTIILDTRSKEMYDKKHIKGAVHLNFSDFSQENLKKVIPHLNTTVLIYCNNNFSDDNIHFMSKVVLPKSIDNNTKEVSLALNIPAYINLYGYGYKNVYELSEYLSVLNKDIKLEGTAVYF